MALRRASGLLLLVAAVAAVARNPASAATRAAPIAPSGVRLIPTAAAGAHFIRLDPHLRAFPGYRGGQAVTTLTSPDGKTLLIPTSGYNRLFDRRGLNPSVPYPTDRSGADLSVHRAKWLAAFEAARSVRPAVGRRQGTRSLVNQ